MLIDFATGKVIPSDPVLTHTQSLTKSVYLENRKDVDFADQSNNDWEQVLKNNNLISPSILIQQFGFVLQSILKGEEIDANYCRFMIEQCLDWEESDKCTLIE